MTSHYSEKLIENFIKNYPDRFIGEPLGLISQQPLIGGFRPDLIMRDASGRAVIIEVQLNALDRNHLYRVLEYRDLLLASGDRSGIRMILVSNDLPERFNPILKTHGVESIVIDTPTFLQRAKELEPGLKIRNISNIARRRSRSITASKILSQLTPKKRKENGLKIDAMVFWLRDWYLDKDIWNLKYENLNDLSNKGRCYFNDLDALPKRKGRKNDFSDPIYVPKEIVVSENILGLSRHKRMILRFWLEYLGKYHRLKEYEDEEVVFGWRGSIDLFDYENYIKGQINVLKPLWNVYTDDSSHNVGAIFEDLTLLSSLKLYGGKYPNYIELLFCESFDIEEGAGHLVGNWTRKKSFLSGFRRENEISQIEQFALEFAWHTVKFKRLSRSYIEVMKRLLNHMCLDRESSEGELRSNSNCWDCLWSPAKLKNLDADALKLAAKYFSHLKVINVLDE